MMVTLKALAAQYRCLFVDVHGVLHDGNAAFPAPPMRCVRRGPKGCSSW
jgi:hypothetical protein